MLVTNPYDTVLKYGEKKNLELGIYLRFVIPSVVLLGLVVMAIELEIRWNNFKDVNSMTTSGQIIPLTIGACSLLRAVALLVGFLKGDREDTPSALSPPEDNDGRPIL